MIKQKIDSRGVRWLVVRKVENPETKKNLGYSTDFSWELWNTAAQQYMQSIEALSYERTLEIFKEAYQLTDWLGRQSPFIQVDNDMLSRLELLPAPGPLIMSTTSLIGTCMLLTMLKALFTCASHLATERDEGEIR